MNKHLIMALLLLIIYSCSESPTESEKFPPIEITPYEGNLNYPTTYQKLSSDEVSERQEQFNRASDYLVNSEIDSLGFLRFNYNRTSIRELSTVPIHENLLNQIIMAVKYELVKLHKYTGVIDTSELLKSDIRFNYNMDVDRGWEHPTSIIINFYDNNYLGCLFARNISVVVDYFGIYSINASWFRHVALPESIIISEDEAINKLVGMKVSHQGDPSNKQITVTKNLLSAGTHKIIYPYYSENKLQLRLCYNVFVFDEVDNINRWQYYVDTESGEILGGGEMMIMSIED